MRNACLPGLILSLACLTGLAHGQGGETPDILHAGSGQITWTNINPALYYTVEWRNSLTTTGEWRSVYSLFRDVQSQDGVISREIPAFFQIRAHDTPEYLHSLTATSSVVQAGYYAATNLTLVEPNLTAANIRGGATIFGIQGVVLPSTGDATPTHVLDGRTFSNTEASGATGTMPDQGGRGFMPGTADVAIPAGYYNGSGVVTGDAALVTGNIRSGVTLFGVPGTVLQATGDATAAEVLTGRSFSRADAVDVAGTMANRGEQNVTPGTTPQAILQGYHSGAGEVAGDADLTAANIKAGINIFGVTGTVVESTGDAGVGQVLAGATFSKAGEAGLTGTMPDQGGRGFMPGTADVPIPAGYYDGSGVVTGDAALVTGNIRAGQAIFGVAGKTEVVDTTSGDAAAGDLLEGKKAWVDGVEITGTVPAGNDVVGANGALAITIPDGLYSGLRTATANDTDLLAANIREGVTVFGVTGTGEKSGMALIPAGDFVKTDHPDGANWVTNYISAFYMSRTHITKAQWDAVQSWAITNEYTDLPLGGGKGADHPVHSVNWYDVVKWCNARSEMEGRSPAYYTDGTHATVYRTGDLDLTNACVAWTTGGYRLPTESEWEKAARGGLEAHRFPWAHGSRTNMISHHHANFRNGGPEIYHYGPTDLHHEFNIGGTPYTSPVGSFAPNGYGLYDMAGNVFDWCWDWRGHVGYYVAGSDLRGPDTGFNRMLRGGSWAYDATHCRSAGRFDETPDYAIDYIGFRVVLPSAVAP